MNDYPRRRVPSTVACLVVLSLTVVACGGQIVPSQDAASSPDALCATYNNLIAIRPLVTDLLQSVSTGAGTDGTKADQVFETLKTTQDVNNDEFTGTSRYRLATEAGSAAVEIVVATGEISQSVRESQTPSSDSIATLGLGLADLDAARAENTRLAQAGETHC